MTKEINKEININNLNAFFNRQNTLLTKDDKAQLLNETRLLMTKSGDYAKTLDPEALYYQNMKAILMTSKNKEKIDAEWKFNNKALLYKCLGVLYTGLILGLGLASLALTIGGSIGFGMLTGLGFGVSMSLAIVGTLMLFIIGGTLGAAGWWCVFDTLNDRVYDTYREKEKSVVKLEAAYKNGVQAYNACVLFFNSSDKKTTDKKEQFYPDEGHLNYQ